MADQKREFREFVTDAIKRRWDNNLDRIEYEDLRDWAIELLEARSVSQGAATERYRLTAPVPEGYAFWGINDMKTMQSLVTIFKDFPDAEAEIKRLYEKLGEER